MDKIRDYLWIGDIVDAREELIPTDAVVTVCQDRVDDNISCELGDPDVTTFLDGGTRSVVGDEYAYFNMADGTAAAQYGGSCEYGLFAEAVKTVRYHIERGNSVFVHCHMGRSRSASVCIAVLALIEDRTFDSALEEVQKARPEINPDFDIRDHAEQFVDKHQVEYNRNRL